MEKGTLTPNRMKRSEARLLFFISRVPPEHAYARNMSIKLNMDYAYALLRLKSMKDKGWIRKIEKGGKNRKQYAIRKQRYLEEAKQVMQE